MREFLKAYSSGALFFALVAIFDHQQWAWLGLILCLGLAAGAYEQLEAQERVNLRHYLKRLGLSRND